MAIHESIIIDLFLVLDKIVNDEFYLYNSLNEVFEKQELLKFKHEVLARLDHYSLTVPRGRNARNFRMTLYLPIMYVKYIDLIVKLNPNAFDSRSEYIRLAIQRFIKSENGLNKVIYSIIENSSEMIIENEKSKR